MKKPLVSIVMPAYNVEKYVDRAIQSVLEQTYSNWELLVSDDGSLDNTKNIIDSYKDSRVKRYHNPLNRGNIFTRNKLFSLAKGDLIAVQDADDWSHKNRIEKQVKSFLEDAELGACGTNYFRVKLNGEITEAQNLEGDLVEKGLPILNMWPPSIMVKKSIYEQVGGLNLYFDRLLAEDFYWIHLIIERCKVLCLAEPLYYYRQNPASLTNELGHVRKLVASSVVGELIKQRRKTGTDWLEKEEFDKLEGFEANLFNDKKWLSNRYRIYAAVSADTKKYASSLSLMKKSFQLYRFGKSQFQTLFYLIRSYIKDKCSRVKL